MGRIENYNFQYNNYNYIIDYLTSISPKNLGDKITEEDIDRHRRFNKSVNCNPRKRRHIIWKIINSSTITDSLFYEDTIKLLRECCKTIDLINMIRYYSRNFLYNTSHYHFNDQVIKDRSSYIDKNAIKTLHLSITLFNSFNKDNFQEHCARELLKNTINKMIYFNIIGISNEFYFRKKQLRSVYEQVKYYENNQEFETAYGIEKLNKNLRNRFNYILKNNVPFFNTNLLTNYVNEIIQSKNACFIDNITIFYLNDWNVFLKNETLVTDRICGLINNIEHTQLIITSLNNFTLKEKFKNLINNCQPAIINLLNTESIKLLEIIDFISYYRVNLKDYLEIPVIILGKFNQLLVDSATYNYVFKTICSFLWEISCSLDIGTYILRNVFIKSIFKIINSRNFDIRIDFILTNLYASGQYKSIVNYFAHENDEFNINAWNCYIDNFKNDKLNIVTEEILKKNHIILEQKGCCTDSITCTIIEEPVIIPNHNFVDKYSIYPYLLLNKMNPYNRQTLTIEFLEDFNENNNSLIQYKIKHGYTEKKIN